MKLARGLSGRSAVAPPTGAAKLVHADPKSLDRCLKRQWKRYRKALKRAKKDFSEKSTHDYRIEARRLMAELELLLPFVPAKLVDKLRQNLKAHLDISDQLRDTQVQLLTLKNLRPAEPGLRGFAAWLQNRERRFKKKTRSKLKSAKVGRIQKLLAAGRKALKNGFKKCTTAEALQHLLEPAGDAFARTKKLYGRIKPDHADTIHRTRVSFKKFRYLVEALAEIVPGLDCGYLDELHAYQGLMGNIQDRRVLIESFYQWVADAKPDVQWALQMRARLSKGQMDLVRTYLRQADRLLSFWPVKLGDTLLSAQGRPLANGAGTARPKLKA